ncbi:MAG: FAD-binding oxidoreductase, partial [candidate division WOR-3 bacterium]
RELKKKFPEEFFIEEEVLYAYSFDTSFFYSLPKAVFIPKEKNKLIDIVSLLLENKIPVTPRGKATGRSGGCVPHPESVVVSTERLKNKIEFFIEDEILYLEPGFTIDEINEFLKNYGYFYPVDPASSDIASIGGTVATNAGGPRALRYGVTINYVNGLSVLISDGTVLNTRGLLKKNKLFYPVEKIFVGSEGTLGLITEIYLKVIRIPEYKKSILIESEKKEILKISKELIKKENITLCEIMEWENKFLLWTEYIGKKEDVIQEIEKLKKTIKGNLILPFNQEEEEKILSLRKKYSNLMWNLKGRKKSIDVTVPVSKIDSLILFYEKLENKYKIKIIPYGHFGDGNIHTSIIFEKRENGKAEKMKREICEYVLDIGGTVTGEHGFGIKYIMYTKRFKEYEIMKKIKKALDPYDLFNPSKIEGEFKVNKYEPGENKKMCILCSLCNLYSDNYKKFLREDKGTRGEIFLSKIKGNLKISKENKESLKYCPLGFEI